MNNNLNCTHKIQSIKKADGILTDESLEQADIFDNFFGSVFTTDDAKIQWRAEKSCNLFDVSFMSAVVFVILKRSKPSTSTGPDGLPNVLLFDTPFKDNLLPVSWKLGNLLMLSLFIKKVELVIQIISDQFH